MNRSYFLRKFSLIVLFLFFPIVSISLHGIADEGPSQDAFVSAALGDARVLIPFLADDSSSGAICGLIYSGLTKFDKNLNVVGDLAERWEISDGGLAITFFLRDGIKWQDGKDLTAEDVKYTFETILDEKTKCPYISAYSDIKQITVVDRLTVRFDYARPYAPALSKLGMGIIPKHVFSGEKDIRKSYYAVNPIGTGPYKFEKWDKARDMILEANPYYYEHPPRVKRYVTRIIPDQAVQFLELITGGIDSMDLTPYQFIYRSDTPKFTGAINKYRYLSHAYTYLGYNLLDPIFNDVNVRKALSHAINRQEIIDSALLGQGEECSGPFLKGTPYYDESVTGYEYDPMKARQLLAKAGWEDIDGDGILEKGEAEFRVKIVVNQGNQAREDAATIVQSRWAEVGVKAEIQVVAWSAFLDQFINKKNFQAVILGWTIPQDPDVYPVWHTDSSRGGGLNFISYSNSSLDGLIEKGRREFDPVQRGKIYKEIHRTISEDAPYTFLFFPYALPAVHKRFEGVEPSPAGIGHNFIDWHVEDDDVRYKF